jgi:hypothetical protein
MTPPERFDVAWSIAATACRLAAWYVFGLLLTYTFGWSVRPEGFATLAYMLEHQLERYRPGNGRRS